MTTRTALLVAGGLLGALAPFSPGMPFHMPAGSSSSGGSSASPLDAGVLFVNSVNADAGVFNGMNIGSTASTLPALGQYNGGNLNLNAPSGYSANITINGNGEVQASSFGVILGANGQTVSTNAPLIVSGSVVADAGSFTALSVSGGTSITALVVGSCAMSSGTTCTVSDTGVSATSVVHCAANGTSVGTLSAFSGAVITAGTSYQVNATVSNSDTWRCIRFN